MQRLPSKRLVPSSEDSLSKTSDELMREMKQSYQDFSWECVPGMIVHGVRFLAEYTQHTGEEKKRVLTRVLVELCPDDDLDKLIPPVIDVIWTLVKALIAQGCCERAALACCVS